MDGVLIHFPRFPYRIDTFFPNRALATLAESLASAGCSVTVMDAGTVEMFGSRIPPEFPGLADPILNDLDDGANPKSLPVAREQLRRIEEAIDIQDTHAAKHFALEVASVGPISFVVFDLTHPGDLKPTTKIVSKLRSIYPDAVFVAWGLESRTFEGPECDALRESNVVVAVEGIGGVCSALRAHAGIRLADVPKINPSAAPLSLSPVPGIGVSTLYPTYSTDWYPAMNGDSKLRVFRIDEFVQSTPEDVSGREPATILPRSPRDIVGEVRTILAHYPGASVIFDSGLSLSEHARTVARELLKQGIALRYGRKNHVCDIKPDVFPLLKASGCTALGLEVSTGSQLLLDRYYHAPVGVSAIERLLRAAKVSGLCTIAQFEFPCPDDDYHTSAETLRLIERTRPDSAPIYLPNGPKNRQYCDETTLLQRIAGLPERSRVKDSALDEWSISTDTMYIENQCLLRQVAECNVSFTLDVEVAVLAAVMGEEGLETAFERNLHRILGSGDLKQTAEFVQTFNRRTLTRTRSRAFKPFSSDQAVVGN